VGLSGVRKFGIFSPASTVMLSAQLTALKIVFIVNLTFVVVSILKLFKLGNEESQNPFKVLSQKYKE
jgi:hypothetical protein